MRLGIWRYYQANIENQFLCNLISNQRTWELHIAVVCDEYISIVMSTQGNTLPYMWKLLKMIDEKMTKFSLNVRAETGKAAKITDNFIMLA